MYLLHAIPDFYLQYGFRRVLDLAEHVVDVPAALNLKESAVQVREALDGDAQDILDLYRRHFEIYSGSFSRSLEQQRHYLQARMSSAPPLVAVGPFGRISGYLVFPESGDRTTGAEVVANLWPAAQALLNHHARLLKSLQFPQQELIWYLPLDSLTYYLVCDHLEDVRTRIHSQPNSGWMARIIKSSHLMEALLPALAERWKRSIEIWNGEAITLNVGNDRFVLSDRDGVDIRMAEEVHGLNQAWFSEEVFVQLVFGYRSIWWAANEPEQQIPPQLLSVLDGAISLGPQMGLLSSTFFCTDRFLCCRLWSRTCVFDHVCQIAADL